jgi:NAD(P)-dependent dehydrogenase (short-subunit alcohol dehydrogenase family)
MRHAIVTGAGHGIGAKCAQAAAAAGYRVGVLDIDGDRAGRIARTLEHSVALVADIRDAESLDRAFQVFDAAPDLVVCNAGLVRFGPLLDLSLEDWRNVVDVNLTGTFITARAAARRMRANNGGSIVAITSMNGVVPGPNAGAYGATKAAIALFVQQAAIEWGAAGIRVNAVAPGLIDAGMSAPIYSDPEFRRARATKVPLRRLGTPDDVAALVMFLASEAASYITGQNILVDGGVTMNMIGQLPRPAAVDGVGRPSES